MKKLLTVCILTLLLLALFVVPALASSGGVTVLDRADLLTSGEEAGLRAYADTLHGTKFYLVTSSSRMSSSSVRSLCGLADGTSAIVLVVDHAVGGAYYYEMFAYGHADDVISRRASDAILDDSALYSAIKGGRIFDGAARFFTLTASRIDKDWFKPGERFGGIGVTIAVGIIVALLAGGGTALGVFLVYRRKLHGTVYPLDRYASLQLTYRDDRFVGSSVTRVRIQRASSGGGGKSRSGGGSRGRR